MDYLLNKDNKIDIDFFRRETFLVAEKLLGKILVTNINGDIAAGKIVEVEPYIASWDKASHSYPNKVTGRTRIQFTPGGVLYVYLIYGIHYQLCIVTEAEGVGDVVLIRALEPVYGLEIMRKRRGEAVQTVNLANGPGKLCTALGIDKSFYAASLLSDKVWLVRSSDIPRSKIMCAPRIGIDYAGTFAQKPWRMYIKDNKFVSALSDEAIDFMQACSSFEPGEDEIPEQHKMF